MRTYSMGGESTGRRTALRGALALAACLTALGCSDGLSVSPEGGGGDGGTLPPLFVAVGAQGALLTSTDGAQWTQQASGTTAELQAVASNGEVLVAVGRGGTILASSDGTTWALQSSPTLVDFADVIYAKGLFFAVGGDFSTGGMSATSVDGITWQPLPSPSTHLFDSVVETPMGVVASAILAADGVDPALFRHDGATGWTRMTGPPFADAVFVDGVTYTVEGRALSQSSDGVSWSTHPVPAPSALRAVSRSDTRLVVVGEGGALFSSSDGTQWTPSLVNQLKSDVLTDVAAGDGRIVTVGRRGAFAASPDGITWSEGRLDPSLHLTGLGFSRIAPAP